MGKSTRRVYHRVLSDRQLNDRRKVEVSLAALNAKDVQARPDDLAGEDVLAQLTALELTVYLAGTLKNRGVVAVTWQSLGRAFKKHPRQVQKIFLAAKDKIENAPI